MKEYLPLMRRNLLFDRIDEEDLIKTLTCLNMQIMQCEKGKVILHQGIHPDTLACCLPVASTSQLTTQTEAVP